MQGPKLLKPIEKSSLKTLEKKNHPKHPPKDEADIIDYVLVFKGTI